MTKEEARKLGRDIGRSASLFLLVWTLAAVGHGAGIVIVGGGLVIAFAAILLGRFLLDRVGQ